MTLEEFISRARKKHGNKYDYSLTKDVGYNDYVKIICHKHGEFLQKAKNHLSGCGCQKCAYENRKNKLRKRKTTEEFINECVDKYGDKYDYSKVEYKNANSYICVINKETGKEKWIEATTFLSKGLCDTVERLNTENFIERAKKVHGNKYDYSITKYEHAKRKIKYICPEHGVIEQLPSNHLRYGCKKCSINKIKSIRAKTTEDFIKEAIKVHGERYDYSKVNYVNYKTKICIICNEHGEFWQSPSKHLAGHGCHKCKNSKLENEIESYLSEHSINYEEQYSPQFLKNGRGQQRLDFYLPDYNLAIECQGIQHFIASSYGPLSCIEDNQRRDRIKAEKCKNEGIPILYYTPKENIKYMDLCEIYNENNIYCNLEETIIRINKYKKQL